jgi:putative peptidoglycan lipid II flippase
MVRAVSLVSGLTMTSRILGVVREQAFAALFGAGGHADAFVVAFRIPNLLRDLFAEGALSAAFVPTYAAALAEGGRRRADELAGRVVALLLLAMSVLLLAGFLGSDWIVARLAPGFGEVPGKSSLAAFLTRVMLPFLPLVSLAAVAMGMLNAERRYGPPAFAPATFNIVTIAVAFALWQLGWSPDQLVLGWSLGVILGGVAQLGIQLPALRGQGFRLRPSLARDPGVGRILRLMLPATVGMAAVQINIFVNTYFASFQDGALTWLQLAFRVVHLPIGVFGVAIGTIAAAGLARRAAAGDMSGLQSTLVDGLRLLAFLTIPASVGAIVLREPIVRLLFERGAFGPEDTAATATALALYALGLVGYTGVKVVVPAFYALDKPRVPLLGSSAAVAANLVVVLALHRSFGFGAIALGTALGSLVNCALLVAAFERRWGGLRGQGISRSLLKMVAATIPMGALAWLSELWLSRWLGTAGVVAGLATCFGPILLSIVAYGAVAALLRLREVTLLLGLLRRGTRPAGEAG